MKNKIYIAHSKLIDKEKGKDISVQPYEKHIEGVYNGCINSINRIEKYVDHNWFSILKTSVSLAAIYHDLGKLDEQSQKLLYAETKTKEKMINHVDAGVAFLLSQYKKTNNICYLIASYLVLSHHIGLPNYDKIIKTEREMLSIIISPTNSFRDRKSLKKYKMGRKMVKTHVDKNLKNYLAIHNKLCKFSIEEAKFLKNDALSFIRNPMALKVAISILVDADHEDTSKNYGDEYPTRQLHMTPKYYLENLMEKIRNMSDDYEKGIIHCSEERFKLRQEFFELCGNVDFDSHFYLVDGTVGIGKTLAVMHMALKMAIKLEIDTLIFVLPYISLIDQSAEQYEKYLFSRYNESDYNMNIIHSIFKAKGAYHRKYTKGFNAPVNLTTSVNFFGIISSNQTCIFRNIHKFVGSIIAIDEYHAIADYKFWPSILSMMSELSRHFSCHFILSSGTPIRFWEIDAITNCLKNNISVKNVIPDNLYRKMMDLEEKRVNIITSIDQEWTFNYLSDEILKQDKSVFVILNTRKKAVALTNYLMGKTKRNVYLRFSGISPLDRTKQYGLIKESVDKQEPVIVVATQGSDIGLDLSFFCGFKESSSYDSISQMKGRINRGCEFKDSFLHIFKLCSEPNEDGVVYRENPTSIRKIDVFESATELHKYMSPEYSTDIAEKEVSNMSSSEKNKMNYLCKMWNENSFEDFSEEFSLINMPMIHLIINSDIFEKLKKEEYIPYNIMQKNIVNLIWSDKNMDLLKDHLILIDEELNEDEESEEDVCDEKKIKNNTFGLYYWKGIYDPNNFGIFADPVFGIIKLSTLVV